MRAKRSVAYVSPEDSRGINTHSYKKKQSLNETNQLLYSVLLYSTQLQHWLIRFLTTSLLDAVLSHNHYSEHGNEALQVPSIV